MSTKMMARTNSGERSMLPVREGGRSLRNGRNRGSVTPHRKRTMGLRGSGFTHEIRAAMMTIHWSPVSSQMMTSNSAPVAEPPTFTECPSGRGSCGRPRSEQRRSDTHLGRALLDGDREVVAHAHRELGKRPAEPPRQAVAQARETAEVRARFFRIVVVGRDRHQASDLQMAAAKGRLAEAIQPVRRDTRLAGLGAQIDF